MTTLLYVTAPGLDHKQFNYILLHLREWEIGCRETLKLVTTKNAYNLAPSENSKELEPTKTPVPIDIENAWAGATLEDIEAFTSDLGRAQPDCAPPVDTGFGLIFVLVDSEGVEHENCILAERHADWDADPPRAMESFRKIRIPWSDVSAMCAHLFIGEVDFEEWAEEKDDGFTSREWYTYAGPGDFSIYAACTKARDEEIDRYRAKGQV